MSDKEGTIFQKYAKKERNRKKQYVFDDKLLRNLAAHIHYRMCSYSHTDQCSFGYESTNAHWDDPSQMIYTFDEHLKCYKAAEKIASKVDRKELEIFIKLYDKILESY